MSKTAEDIKRYYGFKGLATVEKDNVDYRKGHVGQFLVEQYIWLDVNIPEYRVAIPEDMKYEDRSREDVIQSRYLTYKPTGKAIYDNELPPPRAVVWEYKLFHSRDLV